MIDNDKIGYESHKYIALSFRGLKKVDESVENDIEVKYSRTSKYSYLPRNLKKLFNIQIHFY